MAISKSTLKTIIREFHEAPARIYIPRTIDSKKYMETKSVIVFTGPRRSGKTTFMIQMMDEFLKNGYEKEQFIYINFEDERLIGFNPSDFALLEESYYELYPHKKPVFFLDEVHTIDKWWLFVRRLNEARFTVFVTGSNSKLLSKEYVTHIAGRVLEVPILPFSFFEYVIAKQGSVTSESIFSKARHEFSSIQKDFLEWGSFPEVALSEASLRREILSSYIKTVIFRDISSRFKIVNNRALELLLGKLSATTGNPISYRSIAASLGEVNENIPHKTVIEYLNHYESAFVLFSLSKHYKSALKREFEKKWYFVDTGYLNLFFPSPDSARALETQVFLELIKTNQQVYYLKNGGEIDFFVTGKEKQAIQVTFELNANNKEREITPLRKLDASFKKIIVTNDQQESHGDIEVIPFWKFALIPWLKMKL